MSRRERNLQVAAAISDDLGIIGRDEAGGPRKRAIQEGSGKNTLIRTRVDEKVFPGVPLEDGDG